jgi:polyphosphate:AMP phosphotransferase
MFESAAQAHKLDKATFTLEEPRLRAELTEAQLELVESRAFPVIILLTGADGAGKGDVLHRLLAWLDPRHLRVNAYGEPGEEERLRPRFWRYWRDLPPKGEIGVVVGSWYNAPLIDHLRGRLDHAAFERELMAICRFEAMLAAEGALILKMLLYLSVAEQQRRLKAIADKPGASRHVLEEWSAVKRRQRSRPLVETMISRTGTAFAPWIVVPSQDPQYRDLSVGRTISAAIRRRLAAPAPPATTPSAPLVPSLDRKTVLDGLDLTRRLEAEEYKRKLERWQERLAVLTDDPRFHQIAVVAVFEGNDAAGKGGSIRRVAQAIDPRRLRVHPIAAPSDEEKAQPYLWRFWRRLPRKGHIAIFDRSWYGRVLVERVEGFADEVAWLRAYGEINELEEELVLSGIVVLKFWLAISRDEQARRFDERKGVEFKRHKITAEDWRNREKWDHYAEAVGDMVDRTSTPYAPWTMVEAEDKHWARVKVLKTFCRRIEAALG